MNSITTKTKRFTTKRREVLYAVQSFEFKVRASRILSFEGSVTS